MAGNRRSAAFHRREQQSRDERVQRLMVIGIGAIFALVALIVLAGLYWAVWLPPRAHVLTIGDRDVTAGELADHLAFVYRAGDTRVLGDLSVGIEDLVRKEVLLQAGEPEVGPITDDDVRALIRQRLGLADTATDEQYARALGSYLGTVGVSRAELEAAVHVLAIEERLRDRYLEAIPDSGEQIRVLRVTATTREQAEALRDRAAAGEALDEVAVEEGVISQAPQADLGWLPVETLPARIRDDVSALGEGAVTEVLADEAGTGFEVYQVAERLQNREYEEGDREAIAASQVAVYVQEQREALGVVEDISADERSWMFDRLVRAVRSAS